MRHAPNATPQRTGFSLIEVLIGMTVLMIAIAGAFFMTFNLSRQHQSVQYLSSAANLAEYKLEELRNANFDEIISGADGATLDDLGQSPGRYTRTWNVDTDTPATGLKTISVLVTWTEWGESHSYSLAGVIGPWGGVVSP